MASLYRKKLASFIAGHLSLSAENSVEKIEAELRPPPDPALGDISFPCFSLGKNPKEAAAALQQKLQAALPAFVAKAEAAGPYLNFFLNPGAVAEDVLQEIREQKAAYGGGKRVRKKEVEKEEAKKKEKKNIIIEFCGPNTNKPLHLGHLRNMALGNALCRILAFRGNEVHAVNIVNDRGIHICQSMLAYQKWGKKENTWETPKTAGRKGDHFVGDYYVKFAQEAKKQEENEIGEAGMQAEGQKKGKAEKQGMGREGHLQKEAQEMLLQWERKDPKTLALWKKMSAWVLQGFKETYKRFGISFEKEYFESQYYQQGKEIVYEGLKKGIFEKDHTEAILAPLEKKLPAGRKLPNKVLLRGNETSLYITQDLYLAQLRYEDFAFDALLYVVASEQRLHFQQLFAILEMLGKPYAKRLEHISYGMVHLPSGRMKSREGTVIDADDVMDEMAALALEEVKKRHPALSAQEKKKRAEAIALAAIKFFMLRTDVARDIVFNPEESLSFEGETGPYVQYTHARACSILRKAGEALNNGGKKSKSTANLQLLVHPLEYRIVKLLAAFPEAVESAAAHRKPHLLCRHLLDLSQAFNEFYHQLPVISEDVAMMNARLALVDGVREVVAIGLELLGIEALEAM